MNKVEVFQVVDVSYFGFVHIKGLDTHRALEVVAGTHDVLFQRPHREATAFNEDQVGAGGQGFVLLHHKTLFSLTVFTVVIQPGFGAGTTGLEAGRLFVFTRTRHDQHH